LTASIWTTLGIPPTSDRDTIRRAYASRLRHANPEDDPEGFQALRAAYEAALNGARAAAETAAPASSSEIVRPAVFSPASRATLSPGERDRSTIVSPGARLAAVERLLSSEQDPEVLKNAFTEMLSDAQHDDLITFAELESRVAALILAWGRRSDPHVEPAISAFGWVRDEAANRQVLAVLDKADSLQFWRLRMSPRHPDHGLYLALTRPAPTWRRRLIVEVNMFQTRRMLRFLQLIDQHHPSLTAYFDPGAEAWWRSFLSAPRIAGQTIPLATPIAAWCTLVVLLDWPQRAPWLIPAIWLGVPAGVALLWTLVIWGWIRPRIWWMSNHAWRAPVWLRLGAAPASWLAMGLAAASLRSPLLSLGAVALALGAALWSLISGTPDIRSTTVHWFVRALLAHLAVGIWLVVILFNAPGAFTPLMIVVTGSALVVSLASAGGLLNWYQSDISPVARSAAASIVVLIGLGSIWATVVYALGLISAPVLMAIVLPFALALKPITAGLSGPRLNIWYRGSYFGVIVIGPLSSQLGGLAVSATAWLAASCGLGLLLTLTQS
jgi:hypothetical protein